MPMLVCGFFFVQAEGGIRDLYVTGVQTCALPICLSRHGGERVPRVERVRGREGRVWPDRSHGSATRAHRCEYRARAWRPTRCARCQLDAGDRAGRHGRGVCVAPGAEPLPPEQAGAAAARLMARMINDQW